jgi:putative membrane protein
MSIPTSATPSNPPRKGVHVPVWVAAVVGAVVVLAGGFVIGRAVGDHRGRETVRGFDGRLMVRGDGAGHPWFWVAVGLLVIAAIVTGVVVLVRNSASNRAPLAPRTTTAEDLLADRFARGEIDETEYGSRRAALRG